MVMSAREEWKKCLATAGYSKSHHDPEGEEHFTSGYQAGLEAAANACRKVRRDDGESGQHTEWYHGVDACLLEVTEMKS